MSELRDIAVASARAEFARYTVRLLLPQTEAVATEFPCATLSAVAHTMLRLANSVQADGLYDELGELTVSVVAQGERALTEVEQARLAALIQEHGGETPTEEDDIAAYRETNPRRQA